MASPMLGVVIADEKRGEYELRCPVCSGVLVVMPSCAGCLACKITLLAWDNERPVGRKLAKKVGA